MNRASRYTLSVGDLAAATGTSAHTLRYYDGVGLIPRVHRNAAGHRRFADEHIRWIGLLERLRASGMSIARTREYAALADRGDATVDERTALFRDHAADVRTSIADLQQALAIVEAKLDYYEGRHPDLSTVWRLVEEAARRRAGEATPRLNGSTGSPTA